MVTKREQLEAARVRPENRTARQQQIVSQARNKGVQNTAHASSKAQQSGRK